MNFQSEVIHVQGSIRSWLCATQPDVMLVRPFFYSDNRLSSCFYFVALYIYILRT
jgi:hypothetical protein